MRSGKVIVGGKLVDLDACEQIYADGRFRGSRGVTLFRTAKGNLVWLDWTNWQGEEDKFRFVTTEEAVDLLLQQRHVQRATQAILDLGVKLPEE